MDLDRNVRKTSPNQKKPRILTIVIEFENGFPTERTIRCLLRGYGIDDDKMSFSDDYGLKKKSGLLWLPQREIDDSINGFIKFMKFNGIHVDSIKMFGSVHSLYFERKLD